MTLHGSPQHMSIQDLEHMTLPEFARLWTVSYACKSLVLSVAVSNKPGASCVLYIQANAGHTASRCHTVLTMFSAMQLNWLTQLIKFGLL